MLHILLPLAMMQAAPVSAQPARAQSDLKEPVVSLEQQTSLRCSAAFAIVAAEQGAEVSSAQSYPAMEARGKEFFVRSMARVMDDAGLSRDQVAMMVNTHAQALVAEDAVDEAMPACLLLLDASGL